jgi:hypothetical protein
MAHNLIAHRWSVAFRKPSKYKGSLQHIDIIMTSESSHKTHIDFTLVQAARRDLA